MDRRYQIFISSTYEDLVTVRQKATEEILKLGHIPIGMEMFNPDDEEQWKQIKQSIDESDYYVLIVAGRYGTTTKGGISYTEKEYRYAKQVGIPMLKFLISADAQLSIKNFESDPDKLKKLQEFKQELEKTPVAYWKDKGEFATQLVQALINMMEKKPRIGWIRGDTFVSPFEVEKLGLKEYSDKALGIIHSSIQNRKFYEYYKRNLEITLLNNDEFLITISNEVLMKNLDGSSTDYYSPQPCFYNEEQANSYRHENFEINGVDKIGLISSNVKKKAAKSTDAICCNKQNRLS